MSSAIVVTPKNAFDEHEDPRRARDRDHVAEPDGEERRRPRSRSDSSSESSVWMPLRMPHHTRPQPTTCMVTQKTSSVSSDSGP